MADAVEAELMDQGSGRVVKDLFAGAVGGVAQVLIGMFFTNLGYDSRDGSTFFVVIGKNMFLHIPGELGCLRGFFWRMFGWMWFLFRYRV